MNYKTKQILGKLQETLLGPETFRTTLWFLFQLIQTLHAVDKDDPYSGHQFSFSLAPEAVSGSNFTVQDNKGK